MLKILVCIVFSVVATLSGLASVVLFFSGGNPSKVFLVFLISLVVLISPKSKEKGEWTES